MLNLERELNKHFLGCNTNGEPVECPFCHYVSKNKRFSGKIWINNNKRPLNVSLVVNGEC